MRKLLYLEDDDALAFVTKRALERRNYSVTHHLEMPSLITALDETDYDCVLLDLKIGNQNSLHLIEIIHKKQAIPIVILTGYGSIRTAVEAMRLGAVNFLSKPCAIDTIINALENKQTPDTTSIQTTELEPPSLKKQEWETIQKVLDENNGNISATARQLKIHRRTLQRKLQKRQSQ